MIALRAAIVWPAGRCRTHRPVEPVELVMQEHPRSVQDIPPHAARTIVMQGEHAEQVAQLKIDPREHDHLQKCNDKERIVT